CPPQAALVLLVLLAADAASLLGHAGRSSSGGPALQTVPLMLDPSMLVPSPHIRPLESASISPWTYNVSTDSSLLTPVMSEAHCLLRGCLDQDGKEDLSLRSRPIMHQVLVLRRVRPAAGGPSYHYRLESRMVSVGCTCVRPLVQGPRGPPGVQQDLLDPAGPPGPQQDLLDLSKTLWTHQDLLDPSGPPGPIRTSWF
ncbi:unnamed protein product, partial [Menidia menidia]